MKLRTQFFKAVMDLDFKAMKNVAVEAAEVATEATLNALAQTFPQIGGQFQPQRQMIPVRADNQPRLGR